MISRKVLSIQVDEIISAPLMFLIRNDFHFCNIRESHHEYFKSESHLLHPSARPDKRLLLAYNTLAIKTWQNNKKCAQ